MASTRKKNEPSRTSCYSIYHSVVCNLTNLDMNRKSCIIWFCLCFHVSNFTIWKENHSLLRYDFIRVAIFPAVVVLYVSTLVFHLNDMMRLITLFFVFELLLMEVKSFDEDCIQTRRSSPTCIVTNSLPLMTEGKNHGELNFRAMASVGNGYLATVVMSDEIHVSGVFNGHANVTPDDGNSSKKRRETMNRETVYPDWYYNHTHRARIPSPVSINYTLSGNRNKLTGKENGSRRLFLLDVKNGYFAQTVDNELFTIHQKTYAHRSLRNVIVTEVETIVKATKPLSFTVQSNMGPESRDINFEHVSSTKEWDLYHGSINQTEYGDSQRVLVALLHTRIPESRVLNRGLTRDVYITSISTSLSSDGGDDPIATALTHYAQAKKLAEEMNLLRSHATAWSQLWEESNITIFDNVFLAQTVYTSFYYILSSAREDWKHGLSPGGLAMGYEYMGHSFWDQETWMYPGLLMFHPGLGRSLLDYRVQRLQPAMEIAKRYNFRGAMFPWESALSGFEVCPQEVYGRNEIHITADIAFAVNQYYSATGDLDWIKNHGYQVIKNSADFWLSRAVLHKASGKYHINNVMPPDEYHYPVNNSVYTNVIAQINLQFATKFAELLGLYAPDEWYVVAANMHIPFDAELKYHPEFDGFNITDPKSVVKQADTILINFPLMYTGAGGDQARRNDLEYYGKITDQNGPAMTHSMFSIGWNEIGDSAKAHKAFQNNFANMQEPFHVWSEIRGGKGAANFITAAGGYLQAILFGYAGLRLRDATLSFDMHPLPGNEPYCLNGVKHRGESLQFCRNGTTCSVRKLTLSRGPGHLKIQISDSCKGLLTSNHV